MTVLSAVAARGDGTSSVALVFVAFAPQVAAPRRCTCRSSGHRRTSLPPSCRSMQAAAHALRESLAAGVVLGLAVIAVVAAALPSSIAPAVATAAPVKVLFSAPRCAARARCVAWCDRTLPPAAPAAHNERV
eukprot:gene16481-11786_t